MKVWSNTSTLNGLLSDISMTDQLDKAEVALIGGKPIDLGAMPKLKGIFKTGVGTDNVPFEQARERGIVCEFPADMTKNIIFEETANFACHLILEMLYCDVGDFESWRKASRSSLSSKNLLVVGRGNIGEMVCERMKSFMKVSTFDVRENKEDELESLVRAADCLSLHVPLNDATKGWFDKTKLSWMKDGASLVNTARGPVIDEDALYTELDCGRLRASLDVFCQEPYRGKLLEIQASHLRVTPHIASTCSEFLEATARDFRAFLERLAV